MARPRIIVTGASGFVGRHLLNVVKEHFQVFAFGRRSQIQCGAPVHPNIAWTQVDIADLEPLSAAIAWIRESGPIDTLIHLAAYYDFTGENSAEYQRTNVDGLRNILELAQTLQLKRFVFASSIAACGFPKPGGAVTEETPPHANNNYARSKRAGEEMIREYADKIPCCIVRFAAIYSDWCEYPPLFKFMRNWLSDGWNSRMIAGHGAFAIPYMHVRCAVSCLTRLLRNPELPESGEVFNASPDGAVSILDIFSAATLSYYGDRRTPSFIPKPLTVTWLHFQDVAGRAIGHRPFERPWMSRYIDRQLTVDASRTFRRLDWEPRSRFNILRRMPFLVEHLRTQPFRWNKINHAAMRKEETGYGLKIQWLLEKHQDEICRRQVEALLAGSAFGSYRRFDRQEMGARVLEAISSLRMTIRTREMEPVGGHCLVVARERFEEGFSVSEVCAAFSNLGEICIETLKETELSPGLDRALTERISMAIQFGIDEVLDEYETLSEYGDPP